MPRLLTLLALLLVATLLRAGTTAGMAQRIRYKDGPAYIYRVYLTDKQGCGYSLDHPQRFLSRRAVERRRRQQLAVDSTDLPVSAHYVRLIENQHLSVVGQSRWHNTVLVRTADTTAVRRLGDLPCVKDSRLVWIAPDSVEQTAERPKYSQCFDEQDSVAGQLYGKPYRQLACLHGQRLHDIGCRGEGMMIAVVDGGFRNADRIPALQRIDIRGWRDFVCPPSPSIFAETDHGTKVLSTMAVSVPYYFVGTAPKASYWLLRSEDLQSEQEVEEDYWTMAAEFADSVGCDLINSSLGYNEYDHPAMSHQLWHLDGRTAFVSRSASLLARKGIVLVNSAGNTGMGPWKKLTVPADADDMLTVGAVTADEPHPIAPFSSVGPSQDGRVKPDVVAIGAPAYLVNGRGTIREDMGTSFAAPIICGLTACLWQALPQMTAQEIIRLVRQTGNNCDHPDNIYGYGMPNFWRAYQLGTYHPHQSH
ncbi:MAG: S8 family serine peptidase [Prevotella sp.]|nr:S8 family serine peptidase [Prevotella sp.]